PRCRFRTARIPHNNTHNPHRIESELTSLCPCSFGGLGAALLQSVINNNCAGPVGGARGLEGQSGSEGKGICPTREAYQEQITGKSVRKQLPSIAKCPTNIGNFWCEARP